MQTGGQCIGYGVIRWRRFFGFWCIWFPSYTKSLFLFTFLFFFFSSKRFPLSFYDSLFSFTLWSFFFNIYLMVIHFHPLLLSSLAQGKKWQWHNDDHFVEMCWIVSFATHFVIKALHADQLRWILSHAVIFFNSLFFLGRGKKTKDSKMGKEIEGSKTKYSILWGY